MNTTQDTVDPYGLIFLFVLTFGLPGVVWLLSKLKRKKD